MDTLLMAAVDRLLDAKQDVAALLTAYPGLSEIVDGEVAAVVDLLLSAYQRSINSDFGPD